MKSEKEIRGAIKSFEAALAAPCTCTDPADMLRCAAAHTQIETFLVILRWAANDVNHDFERYMETMAMHAAKLRERQEAPATR